MANIIEFLNIPSSEICFVLIMVDFTTCYIFLQDFVFIANNRKIISFYILFGFIVDCFLLFFLWAHRTNFYSQPFEMIIISLTAINLTLSALIIPLIDFINRK